MSIFIQRLIVAAMLVSAWTVVSCKKQEKDDVPSASSSYKAVTVTNPGSINGTVSIEGGAPSVAPLVINHDNDACGTSHPSPRILCNATGGVKYAVVYLADIKEGAKLEVPAAPFQMEQKGCAYEPHVSVLPLGTTLAVQNLDKNVLHNVHLLLGEETIWNQAQPMYEQNNNIKLRRPGVMTLRCDAGHIWMSGYVWVVEHPYYAVTDENGAFTLPNVPPGTYTLVSWHEGWNATEHRAPAGDLAGYSYDAPHEVRQQVTVQAGTPTTVAITIPAH